jgi:dihydropyrimidinase
LAALYHAGVGSGQLSFPRFVALTSTTPARLFGLYPRKGTIAAGADADLVLWDARRERVLSARTHHMRVDYNLFEGMTVMGAPVGVWLRGAQIVRGDRLTAAPGSGRYLRRDRFDAGGLQVPRARET